jgi:CHAT domain-containing protein
LSGDEALVLFSVVDRESYVFALTRERFDWKPLPLGADALSRKVAAFRRGLDVDKINNATAASGNAGLFDLALANELYATLLGPVEQLVKDKRSLIVVPSGALTFHLLVTERPAAAIPEKIEGYRDAAWLLKRLAVSVLPSVASLKALPRLPDTADELDAVARDLGVAASDIHLGADASETTVKRAPLADYGIVYFATHGLVAGDVKGLAEPSLVLTIPKQPSELDDGLLGASEVAQLKLNADWVVLSACNTIAGDKPGAEALSGLARSFFYAGQRSGVRLR